MTLFRSTLAARLITTSIAQAEAPALVLAIGGEPETGFDPLLGWGSYGNPLFQSTLLKRDVDLATRMDLATARDLETRGFLTEADLAVALAPITREAESGQDVPDRSDDAAP